MLYGGMEYARETATFSSTTKSQQLVAVYKKYLFIYLFLFTLISVVKDIYNTKCDNEIRLESLMLLLLSTKSLKLI